MGGSCPAATDEGANDREISTAFSTAPAAAGAIPSAGRHDPPSIMCARREIPPDAGGGTTEAAAEHHNVAYLPLRGTSGGRQATARRQGGSKQSGSEEAQQPGRTPDRSTQAPAAGRICCRAGGQPPRHRFFCQGEAATRLQGEEPFCATASPRSAGRRALAGPYSFQGYQSGA